MFFTFFLYCTCVVSCYPIYLGSGNSQWYTVKKVREFSVPRRDVTTKLSLGGNNDVITELFLPRRSLVSDIPAGDGKLMNLFYGVARALRLFCMLTAESHSVILPRTELYLGQKKVLFRRKCSNYKEHVWKKGKSRRGNIFEKAHAFLAVIFIGCNPPPLHTD
jgi:hypothetical protein